jgi:Peptidase family M28
MRLHRPTVIPAEESTSCSLVWWRAGLLPADSDYRMFSYKHYGSLPGLDIAFLLDGAAYHTDRDTVDRLRPGTLQARRHASGFRL